MAGNTWSSRPAAVRMVLPRGARTSHSLCRGSDAKSATDIISRRVRRVSQRAHWHATAYSAMHASCRVLPSTHLDPGEEWYGWVIALAWNQTSTVTTAR